MCHFNEYGCKIGMTAPQKKRENEQVQQRKVLEARKKEEAAYIDKKRKYEVMKLNISGDDKLTTTQLRSLLNMEKRKKDKPISNLKKERYVGTLEGVKESPT